MQFAIRLTRGIREIAWNKEGARNVSSNFVLPTVKFFVIGGNLERRLVHSPGFEEIIISSSVFTNMMNILFDLRRLWILLTQIPREIDDTVSRFASERRKANFLGFFFFFSLHSFDHASEEKIPSKIDYWLNLRNSSFDEDKYFFIFHNVIKIRIKIK